MSTFGIYLIGFFIFVAALAYGAYLIGVPPIWIGVGVAALVGLGILTGAGKTRSKDTPEEA